MYQIERYTKNTHAKTHSSYDVNIIQIFKVSREGESKQFEKASLAFFGGIFIVFKLFVIQ